MSHTVTQSLRLSLLLSVPLWCAFVGDGIAACVTDASHNVTCDGVIAAGAGGTPITVYDQAAAFQPTGGSNAYTPANPAFPAISNPGNPGYNSNPATAFVTIDPGATFNVTVTSANKGTAIADGGLIVANYSNSEQPVNNVTINNSGSIILTNTQPTTANMSRVSALVGDSQVNSFVVNNTATGVITANQATASLTTGFNSANLSNLPSTTVAPTPPTYTPKYTGFTLAITSALYSDDNTNSFAVNNAGTISATGHFAAAYYGRAATTITNSGTLGNSDWTSTDRLSDGHWAVATFAGAEFATLAGSNPDSPIYDVKNIAINGQGYSQGTIVVTDTNATTIKNTGTISGDVLVLDTNPLVTAAAAASSQSLPLAVSASNSGPRDSSITNSGTVNGSFYLGSGAHTIDNAAGATIAGAINVDQRASIGAFAAVPTPGTAPGTFASTGSGTSSTGTACPAANTNTTDLFCAKSSPALASFVGEQTFKLSNKGTLTGDITIIDQPTSVNKITLEGTGFSGNIIAVNGTGSNTLLLNNVTNLASVQNFTNLSLNRSNVAVSGGVSLVNNATLKTTIYGPGGTLAAPSQNLGTINGTLTLAGTTTITPTINSFVRNGDVYQLASTVDGAGTSAITVTPSSSALVTTTADTSTGKLLLETNVRDARTISGITQPAGATLQGLLTYNGTNPQVQALGALVEGFTTDAAVRQAGTALSPITNGAEVQTPINSAALFNQSLDSRLDGFIYAQIPSSGRSADLGVPHPVPVYGALPASGSWIEGIGGGVNQKTANGINGYDATLAGVIGGYDRLILPNVRIGGAFGYIDGRVNGNAAFATREDVQTYQGLAYASYEQSNFYARGSVGYGGVHFQSSRVISFANFNDIATGSRGGNILTTRGEVGAPYEYLSSLLVPYAAFTYSRLQQNGYTEQSANGAGLTYQGANNDSERSEVGGKFVVPLGSLPAFSTLFPSGSVVALEGRAAYVHEFGNVGQTVAASFTGGGNVFVATGPIPSRDMIDYGVGLRMGSGPVQFDLSYNGLARSTYLQQVGLLRARYVF